MTCSSKMVYIYISIHMCNMFKEIKMPTLLKVDSIIKKSLIHYYLGCSHKGFSRGFDITTEPRWTMVLDLKDKDAPTLLKEMDQQTRWSINRSLKYPIHVKTLEKKDFYLFKDMLDATSKRRHFDSYPLSYLKICTICLGKIRLNWSWHVLM